jgi:hypothetical protein
LSIFETLISEQYYEVFYCQFRRYVNQKSGTLQKTMAIIVFLQDLDFHFWYLRVPISKELKP